MLQGSTVCCGMFLKTLTEGMKRLQGMCDVMVRIFLLLAEVFDSCQNESAYQKGVNVPQIVFEKIPMLPKAEVTRLVIHFINNTLPLMWRGKSCQRKRGITRNILLSLALYPFFSFSLRNTTGKLNEISAASGLKSDINVSDQTAVWGNLRA